MGYIKNMEGSCKIGDTVKLTKEVSSMAGKFEKDSIVKIIGKDPMRGFDYEDEHGNRVIEAGRDCVLINTHKSEE